MLMAKPAPKWSLSPGSRQPCMLCTRQVNPTDIQLDRQGLLDDPNYIEQSGREPVSGAPNVAAYSASVSAALLAQFVSLTAHPGRRGVPPPLRYLLSTHSLQALTDTTGQFANTSSTRQSVMAGPRWCCLERSPNRTAQHDDGGVHFSPCDHVAEAWARLH